MKLPIGTKSLLYGVHCIPTHTLAIALAWTRLYGFPWSPKLWCAFVLHDIGYLGKPNMDGNEGKHHVDLGASIMEHLFPNSRAPGDITWSAFMKRHSRSYCKETNSEPSQLCYADKLATVCTPNWLYILQGSLSGEIHEYISNNNRNLSPRQFKHFLNQWTKEWISQNIPTPPRKRQTLTNS